MATGNVNVAATDFCNAVVGKPHLWKELEKKSLIHKSKGRGRIERIEQPANSVPLIYVAFGKEHFRINSNILNNGSYQLVLPNAIAKEIGIRNVSRVVSKPLPKATTSESTNILQSANSPPPNCIICQQLCADGEVLSNGFHYHSSCYEKALREKEALASQTVKYKVEIAAIEREISKFDTLFGFVRRMIDGSEYSQLKLTRLDLRKELSAPLARLNLVLSHVERIWDYWPTYPPDWERRRLQAIDGADSCPNCYKRTRFLHVHHRINLSKGGANTPENLEVLCEQCHSDSHGGKEFRYDRDRSAGPFAQRIGAIAAAIRQGADIRFTYEKFSGEATRRTITPTRIAPYEHQRKIGRTLCVEGYCHLRKSDRVFAVKRMARVQVVTTRA